MSLTIMRKNIFMAVIALLAMAACSKENIEDKKQPEAGIRGIEVSANAPQTTKTTIDGVNVLWAKGDKVGFVADDESAVDGSSCYTITDEFDGKPSARITVPVKEGTEVTDETQIAFTAYYPYSEISSDGTQVVEIAAEQDGDTGKWGQMKAEFSGTKAELVEKGLTFTHECAYIDFRFKSSSLNGCPVTKVTLTSLDEDRHFTGKTILKVDGLLPESYNHVSVSDPVARLSEEWQGKTAVVAPVDLTGTKVRIDITYTKDGASLKQTKVIAGSNLQSGHKVTLKLNLDKTDFNVISFEDEALGNALATAFGTDGCLTMAQAAEVTSSQMNTFVKDKWPSSGVSAFHEFQYFTGLTYTPTWAFKTIRKITLPYSINKIQYRSFYGSNASLLNEINNTAQITEVGEEAFYNCSVLQSIDLPCVTEIGNKAFYNAKSLESVGDTEHLISIGQYAFGGCANLKSINLSSLESVGDAAFNGCNALTDINSSLATLSAIPASLFNGCMNLQANIKLPETIGDMAFNNCRKIEIDISEFEKVTSIGQLAFLQCQKITGALCLKNIKTLGTQALAKTNISSVDMTGAPLTKIGDYCFKGCTNLKKVTISSDVTEICQGAFDQCENISEIHILSEKPAKVYDSSFTGADNYIIYVPKGCAAAYKSAEGWSAYAGQIQEKQ